MKRLGLRHVASVATVALGLAFAPPAMAAAGHGRGFGGHLGGFGHVGGFGDFGGHTGGFGAEHTSRLVQPTFGGHSFDGGHLVAEGGFAGGERGIGGRRDLGDGLAMEGRAIGGNHLLYGRVPRFGRGGAFIGYYYPDPGTCYQYPGDYSPAVGCYGLEPSF